ncbi:MAG TPA: choice-of-anchor Q domain-containing protein [Herpetosiphonaceae bacterium]
MKFNVAPPSIRRPGMILLLALVALLAASAPRASASPTAQTLYVAPGGANNTACGPISAPCQHIQFAVNKAATGDTILVAAGTYVYRSNYDTCTFLDTRAVVCFVNKNLTIRGGYSPADWAHQDPDSNPTIIDGQGARRGVAAVSSNGVAYLTMSGFTIQNGLAQGTDARGNNDFFRQGTGAGIWGQGAAMNLSDMTIQNSIAIGVSSALPAGGAGAGGGVAITSPPAGNSSQLTRVRFINNQARGNQGATRGGVALGGGVFTFGAVLTMDAVTFTNNRAIGGSSNGNGTVGLQADGLGGAAAFETGTQATIFRMSAEGNHAIGGNAGGANGSNAGNGFGGALFLELAAMSVLDSHIAQNESTGGNAFNGGGGFGGGIHVQNGDVLIERSQIIANRTVSGSSGAGGRARSTAGGGVYLNMEAGASPARTGTVNNTIIADNRIDIGQGTVAFGFGGGMIVQGMQATLNHVTFARNTIGAGLNSGAGLVVTATGGGAGTPGLVTVNHTIFAEHTNAANAPALQVSANSGVTLNRGMFAGNSKNTNGDNLPEQVGTINGFGTMVTAAAGGFVAPGAPSYNYRLQSGSAAIDQATGSTIAVDVDGQPRPGGAGRDIGADEYHLLDNKLYIPLAGR